METTVVGGRLKIIRYKHILCLAIMIRGSAFNWKQILADLNYRHVKVQH